MKQDQRLSSQGGAMGQFDEEELEASKLWDDSSGKSIRPGLVNAARAEEMVS